MKDLRKKPDNPSKVDLLGKIIRKPAPDPWQFKVVLESIEIKNPKSYD